MSRKWTMPAVVVLLAFCGTVLAAKPQQISVAAPNVYSAKIDYLNGFVIVEGENLSPGTAAAIFAGVSLLPDLADSTDNALKFAFTDGLSDAINELGNYVLTITTDGGSFTLTAFVPLALATPPNPPPPGPDCPCSPEWDSASTTPSPTGFAGLTPYCSEDLTNWVNVQFYDIPVGNYWVMWTNWDPGTGTGYCELYIDGPHRPLDSEAQFNACAGYLRNIVTVWGDQGNDCLL